MAHILLKATKEMINVLRQIKPQTLIGWSIGWLAAIAVNALFEQPFGWKFWAALNIVLVIRMTADLLFAAHEAHKSDAK
jgi:hypothetical protein